MESQAIFDQMQKIGGKSLPISLERNPDGSIKSIEYEKEWNEGGTTAVETKNKKGVVTNIEYKDNYKRIKLDKDQVKKLDELVAEKTRKG